MPLGAPQMALRDLFVGVAVKALRFIGQDQPLPYSLLTGRRTEQHRCDGISHLQSIFELFKSPKQGLGRLTMRLRTDVLG